MNFICHHEFNKCPCKVIKIGTSIWTSCAIGDLEAVKTSITKDRRKVLLLDDYGYSPIHYCSQNNYPKILEYLLLYCKGLDIDTNSCGATPLLRAAYSGSVECCKKLLEFGCNVNAIDDSFKDKRTALHKAASRALSEGDVFHQIISLLISYNADQTIRDKFGNLWMDLLKSNTIMSTESSTSSSSTSTISSSSKKTINETTITNTNNIPKCFVCNEMKYAFHKRIDGNLICTNCHLGYT
jgi:ankyrin repeat protein